jgi:excisionase family DNA binding protein
METQILVADEVAEILRVDKQRVYELVRTNRIPVIRLGARQYRFSAAAINRMLNGDSQGKETIDER